MLRAIPSTWSIPTATWHAPSAWATRSFYDGLAAKHDLDLRFHERLHEVAARGTEHDLLRCGGVVVVPAGAASAVRRALDLRHDLGLLSARGELHVDEVVVERPHGRRGDVEL